jgi:hypothetical protein
MALSANSRINELTEQAPLYPSYLTGTITFGATGWLTARPGTGAVTRSAHFGAGNIDFLFTAQGGFFKRERNSVAQVITASGSLPGSGAGAAEEVKEAFKDVAVVPEVESLKALPEQALGPAMPEAVIGSAFISIRKDFIGLVDFLELLRRVTIAIPVRVILKRQFTEGFLYFLARSVTGHPEHLIVVPLYSHAILSILLICLLEKSTFPIL